MVFITKYGNLCCQETDYYVWMTLHLHANHCPRAFCIQKLEPRNPNEIGKELFFKVLVISKDSALISRFLHWKFQMNFYSKQFWHII